MRDHGGNLDEAIARFGGQHADWLDLSTGINRIPYPLPTIGDHAWRDLPTGAERVALCDAARAAYRTEAAILPVAGAQAAIQMIPHLSQPGLARILAPTYNEYAGVLSGNGWAVEEVPALNDLAGATLAIVANPNNPDGRTHRPEDLLTLSQEVERLVVDESFADAAPQLSLAGHAGRKGLLVLRSFGKFYGLAGLRLGFALGTPDDIARLAALAGPWPASGPAIETGIAALRDEDWKTATIARLKADCARMDRLAHGANWRLVGGTALFRLYETANAKAAQDGLARNRIWSRIFPYLDRWMRLGLPGPEEEWVKIEAALATP